MRVRNRFGGDAGGRSASGGPGRGAGAGSGGREGSGDGEGVGVVRDGDGGGSAGLDGDVDADVVVVGAGPTGLLTAAELALLGVRVVVLERLPEQSAEPKANGLVGQVVPALDRRGLYEALSGTAGPPRPNTTGFMFSGLPLDLSLLQDSPVHTLPVPQVQIVKVLTAHALELGVEVRRGHEVTGLDLDRPGRVGLRIEGPAGEVRMTARYVVGADGAHSVTRKLAGIGFPGITYDRSVSRHAHVSVPRGWAGRDGLRVPGHGTVPPFLPTRTERGSLSWAPLPGRPPLVATVEWEPAEGDGPMSLAEMAASIRRVLGAEVPIEAPEGEGPHVLRRLTGGNTRVADRFREGRVLLVGDAAHVYASGGGPGLNSGLQDALNLGWKLAADLAGTAPEGLLDSYSAERGAAARRTLVSAQAQHALHEPGSDVDALRTLFGELLEDESTVRRVAELIAGSDLRYDMGGDCDHPLLGAFAPDVPLSTDRARSTRLAELTRAGRPLLLDLTEGGTAAKTAGAWAPVVEVVPARPRRAADGPAFTAALIRPDSYVAWATSAASPSRKELAELRAAGARWFGVE